MSIWDPDRYDSSDKEFLKQFLIHIDIIHEKLPMMLLQAFDYALRYTETDLVKMILRTFEVSAQTHTLAYTKPKVIFITYAVGASLICYLCSQRFLVKFNGITKVTWADYDYVVFRLALYFRYSCGNIDFDDDSYAASNIKSFLTELNKDYQNDSEISMLESFVKDYQWHLDQIIEICNEEGFAELLTVILNITKDFPKEQPELRL
jgi:hypothetical protein